jgi:hypothetical protein
MRMKNFCSFFIWLSLSILLYHAAKFFVPTFWNLPFYVNKQEEDNEEEPKNNWINDSYENDQVARLQNFHPPFEKSNPIKWPLYLRHNSQFPRTKNHNPAAIRWYIVNISAIPS